MLIAMAVYDTEENERTRMTKATIESLIETVDLGSQRFSYEEPPHALVISDNGSCEETLKLYMKYERHIHAVVYNETNIGTAKAINKAWKFRRPDEAVVKMDNDVVFHQAEWCDWMEDAFSRDPELGILGLKRRDLAEDPWRTDNFHSELRMLPHEKGQRWIVIEEVEHVMGTCQAYSPALLERIGYLVQPGVYGFDDSLSSVRAKVAGFKRAFLCGFEIDHIDPGGTLHTQWKREQANMDFDAYKQMAALYEMGAKDVYEDA